MPNHRIRYTPRDGWDGAESLKTLTLGATFPALTTFKTTPKSEIAVRMPPGREFRSITSDGWMEYEIELRAVVENSDLHRELTAFLAEADGGVEFEFAFDDTKTYSTTALDPATPPYQEENLTSLFVTDFSADPKGDYNLEAGDWIFCRGLWRRSIWFYARIANLTSFSGGEITLRDVRDFMIDDGAVVTHRDFIPKAILLDHAFRKRRGGQGYTDLWDLRVRFREVA